jgi:hypothetical protein
MQRCDDITMITQVVMGNGGPGLKEMVASHEVYIQQQRGSFNTIKWGLVFIGVSNIAIFIKEFLIR